MKLLLLNYPYLQPELRKLGVEAMSAGLEGDCDLVFQNEDYRLDAILSRARFQPDYIIFMDSLNRVIPRGLENSPCPLGLFCLDSTINRFWQEPLAEVCDITLSDQLPNAERFGKRGMNAHWFPLAADTEVYKPLGLEKTYDVTFIGNRNPQTRVKRENILTALEERFKLKVFDADSPLSADMAAEVYNRSRLTLNENLFPAVNLRLFEAMACGAAVLTEETAPGLERLFREGEHLLTYSPDTLIDKVEQYLDDETAFKAVSEGAADIILRKHSLERRAAELMELLRKNSARKDYSQAQVQVSLGRAFLGYWLKWRRRDESALTEAKAYLTRALEADGSADTISWLGLAHCAGGDYFEALKLFQEAAGETADNFRLALYTGELLAMMGDQSSARHFLSRAAEIAGEECAALPGDEAFHLYWANVLMQSGEALEPGLMKRDFPMPFWAAFEHLRRAGEISPVHWEAVGDMLMEYSSPDQALIAYRAAVPAISQRKLKRAAKAAYESDNEPVTRSEVDITISLCMIVKDEEQNLRELLPTVAGAVDQIVIADTGSSDGTVDIAKRWGAEVIHIPWSDDFAAARNLSLEPARGRYIMYLDADDRIDAAELKRLKSMLPTSKDTIFCARLVNHPGGEVCLQRRIFPNRPDLRFRGAVHEQIDSDPAAYKYVEAPLTITHMGYSGGEALQEKSRRNLRILERELKKNPKDYYLHFHAAAARQNLGQHLEAVENLKYVAFSEEARTQQPELYEHSNLMLARIFRRLGDTGTALKVLQEMLKEIPESAAGNYYLGMFYFEEQLYSECRTQMEKFFRCRLKPRGIPVSPERTLGWAHYYMGRCLEHQGHHARAAAEYIKTMSYLDSSAKLHRDAGRALFKAGDYSGSRQYLKLCLEAHPGDHEAAELLKRLAVEIEP